MKVFSVFIIFLFLSYTFYKLIYSNKIQTKEESDWNYFDKQQERENILYPLYENVPVKKQRQLVITTGFGYTQKKIDIFFNSLNKTNYNGEKLIFISEKAGKRTLEYLRNRNIKYIFLDDKWPYFSNKSEYFKISKQTIKNYIPKYSVKCRNKIQTVRYFLLLAFLVDYKNSFDMVLIIDLRDVYFQLNPFSWNIKRGISFFEESRASKIYNQPTNNRWVKTLNYSYEKVKMNYIINGGAIFYTPSEGIDFFKRYKTFHEIVQEKDVNDQSMINVMLYDHYYNGRVNIYKNTNTAVRNLALEVLTSNESQLNSLRIMYKKEKNLIYNKDKSIPVAIHQYDRLKDLVEICQSKYSD